MDECAVKLGELLDKPAETGEVRGWVGGWGQGDEGAETEGRCCERGIGDGVDLVVWEGSRTGLGWVGEGARGQLGSLAATGVVCKGDQGGGWGGQ